MRFLCLDKPVIIQNRWYNKVYSCVKKLWKAENSTKNPQIQCFQIANFGVSKNKNITNKMKALILFLISLWMGTLPF